MFLQPKRDRPLQIRKIIALLADSQVTVWMMILYLMHRGRCFIDRDSARAGLVLAAPPVKCIQYIIASCPRCLTSNLPTIVIGLRVGYSQ